MLSGVFLSLMTTDLHTLLASRPILLDGATGTMLAPGTPPDHSSVVNLHREYLLSGADIIKTHTFCAQYISHPDTAFETNQAAAHAARACADTFSTPARPRFVAGSVGPTSISLSANADATPILTKAYYHQIRGLIRGGADIILIETITDPLNAKAAISAFHTAADAEELQPHLMLSFTICGCDTRLSSGHTLRQALEIIAPTYNILSLGTNCSSRIEYDIQGLRYLSTAADTYRSICPNAGMPLTNGTYPVSPVEFAMDLCDVIHTGLAQIIGGCCGTTPAHIKALRNLMDGSGTPNIL